MKLVSTIYLVLIGLCAFLYYPLAVVYPFGMKTSVNMVFNYEFPHVFLASILSLVFIFLNFQKININDRSMKLVFGAVCLILLSGAIFAVPLYRLVHAAAFFTVPLGVFIAVKKGGTKYAVIHLVSLVFVVNLFFCLFIPGNSRIGFCGNQNWLAATLIGSLPFFILSLKKLPKKVFWALSSIFVVLTIIVLIRTSARALIPAVGLFVLYYLFQRNSRKANLSIVGVLTAIGIGIFIWQTDKIIRGYKQDIRGPLSYSTLELIMSSPFLGSGPGNFQRDIPEYATLTLKKRLYYSSIIEHPHNEFLYMAANIGLPAALIWLLFIFRMLKKRDDFEGLAIQFSLIALFVMGMADKPLQISPSVIIFFIACGLLIPDKFWNEEKVETNQYKVLGGALALIAVIVGIFRIQVDVRSRYHFWKAEGLRLSLNGSNERQIVPDMLEHYIKSSDIDPTFINAAYNAASTSLHFYNDLARDKRLLGRMIRLEPDYSDFNLRIASFYMKQARLIGEGKERSELHAEAEKYYLRNFELSPWSINRCRSVIRFYIETGDDTKAEEWILKARKIAWERHETRYTHTDRTDLKGDMKNWISEVEQGNGQPFNISWSMKAAEGVDYSRANIFQRTNVLQRYPLRELKDLDTQFFKRRLSLLRLQAEKGLTDTQSILNFLASFSLNEDGLSWPLDVFEKGSGSAQSLARLACALNLGIGNESALLVNEKGQELCVLFEGEKCWIWNCRDSVLIQTSIEVFHSSAEVRQQLCGQTKDDFYYELFCFPEAFCLRNQTLADVLVSFDSSLNVCNSPSLDRIRLKSKVGDRKIIFSRKYIRLLDAAAMKVD